MFTLWSWDKALEILIRLHKAWNNNSSRHLLIEAFRKLTLFFQTLIQTFGLKKLKNIFFWQAKLHPSSSEVSVGPIETNDEQKTSRSLSIEVLQTAPASNVSDELAKPSPDAVPVDQNHATEISDSQESSAMLKAVLTQITTLRVEQQHMVSVNRQSSADLRIGKPPLPPPFPFKPQASKTPCANQTYAISNDSSASKMKLRTLHWRPFKDLEEIEGTIWEHTNLIPQGGFDVVTLEELFKTDTARKLKPKATHKKTSIIPPKLAQNLEISLKNQKDNGGSFLYYLVEEDLDNCSPNLVSILCSFAERHSSFSVASDNMPEPANNSERFVIQLMKIPRWQEHLRSIVLKEQANRLAELVAYQIDVVQEAVDVVAHSESLRRLFSLLLVMGNHVNHGNPKGNALGFHISSLPSAVTWSLDDINVDVIGKASKTPLDEIKRNTAELDDLLGSLRLMGSPKIDSFEMTLAGLKAKFDQTKAASDSLERYFGIRAGSQCPDDDDQDISLFALLFEFLNKIGTT